MKLIVAAFSGGVLLLGIILILVVVGSTRFVHLVQEGWNSSSGVTQVAMEPDAKAHWLQETRTAETVQALRRKGFSQVEVVHITNPTRANVAVFVDSTKGVAALLCRLPEQSTPYVDFVRTAADGSKWIVSNAPIGSPRLVLEGATVNYRPGADVDAMVAFGEESTGGAIAPGGYAGTSAENLSARALANLSIQHPVEVVLPKTSAGTTLARGEGGADQTTNRTVSLASVVALP